MTRVVFPFVGDTVGGSHISAMSLMRELPARGFHPVAIVHRDGPLLDLLRDGAIEHCRADLPFLQVGGGLGAITGLLCCVPRLACFLRRGDFALLHANDGRMIHSWVPAARLAGCRSIAHRRTAWSPSRISDRLYSMADGLITISDYIADGMPPQLSSRCAVIANPIESVCAPGTERSRQARDALLALAGGGTPLVAFVGTMQQQKRPEVFVAAASRIAESMPAARFVMLGRMTGEGQALAAAIERSALAGRLAFTGYRSDAAWLIVGADLLLAPAVREGHGRTLVEAMLAGVPVVAAASGGHVEIVSHGETGLLVAPDDAEAMAQAALGLLRDRARAQRLAQQAHDWAQDRFSAGRHADMVAAFYAQVLAR